MKRYKLKRYKSKRYELKTYDIEEYDPFTQLCCTNKECNWKNKLTLPLHDYESEAGLVDTGIKYDKILKRKVETCRYFFGNCPKCGSELYPKEVTHEDETINEWIQF